MGGKGESAMNQKQQKKSGSENRNWNVEKEVGEQLEIDEWDVEDRERATITPGTRQIKDG